MFEIFSPGGGGPDDSIPGGDALQSDGAPRDCQGWNDGQLIETIEMIFDNKIL